MPISDLTGQFICHWRLIRKCFTAKFKYYELEFDKYIVWFSSITHDFLDQYALLQ